MLKLVAALLSFSALVASPGAQAPDMVEYQRHFDAGIEDLRAGRHAEGVAAFERCLEIVPKSDTCAYNIACGYSLAGQVDKAFEWLDRSADWGFGGRAGNMDLAKQDPDLENLRGDPRFAKSLERMEKAQKLLEERQKLADEYAKTPVVYVPPSAPPEGEEIGVLVVLHDLGGTKDGVASGPWKRVADALGMALVAPSGKYLVGEEPSRGMSWVDDANAYLQRYWTYERPVQDAVSAFKRQRKVDSTRVFVAGVGEGAMLAFNIAVSGPGLYKGALLVDGPLVPQLAESKAANAGKMGLRTRILLQEGVTFLAPEQSLPEYAGALRQLLTQWGIEADVKTTPRRPASGGEDAYVEMLVEALRGLEPAAKAAEAGASR